MTMQVWIPIILQCVISILILIFLGFHLRHLLIQKVATRCLLALLASDCLHLIFVVCRITIGYNSSDKVSIILYFKDIIL